MMTMSDVQGEGAQPISAESFALEHTPTWAVAVVCIVFIALSLLMQRGLQRLGTWLLSSHKKPLYEALEKMKEELMLLGFISLLLTAAQNPMSRLCMPASWANQMLPCHFHSLEKSLEAHPPLAPAAAIHNLVIHRSTLLSSGHSEQSLRRRKALSFPNQEKPRRKLTGAANPNFCSKGRVPLMSTESLHQLHIFIFVMAVIHVFYSCFTMLLGFTQLRNWRKWEEETNVDNYNYTDGNVVMCQNHNAPMHLDFHKYIMSSLEDDLKTVIGISGYLWVFVIFFMILNVHGWYAYFWMSFIPVLINLVIGAKLQHIITQLAMETAHAHGLVATPIKPRDELFWFNNPHLLLYLIHFVLFQNAFELAFCIWLVTTFGFNSCFFAKHGFIITRVIVGILAQVLCSYSTLPLYALVSQMGSHYKKAIFADPVSTAVTDWRNKAKANIKQRRSSIDLEQGTEAEGSSRPHSHYHGHDHDHDRAQIHHHNCSSTVVVTSGGETTSQAHHTNVVTQPVDVAKTRIDGTKFDLVTNSPKEYCGHCERLSLTLHMDVADCKGNMDQQGTTQGSACTTKSHVHGNTKTNTVYVKISSDDRSDGVAQWSLECSECNSLKALSIESCLLKNGENAQVLTDNQGSVHKGDSPKSSRPEGIRAQGKRKSVFLKMPRIDTPQMPNTPKGPSLDRMRRLPSREIREARSTEAAREPFRPDLDIPELMMCTTLLNNPREVLEFANASSFSSKSRRAAASPSSHSTHGTPDTSQGVILETSKSSTKMTSAAHFSGHIPSKAIELQKSTPHTAELQTTTLSGGCSKVSNHAAEQEKASSDSSFQVATTGESFPSDEE